MYWKHQALPPQPKRKKKRQKKGKKRSVRLVLLTMRLGSTVVTVDVVTVSPRV